MLTRNKKILYEYAVLGLALPIVGVMVKSSHSIDKVLSAILIITGSALFIWSCWMLLAKKTT